MDFEVQVAIFCKLYSNPPFYSFPVFILIYKIGYFNPPALAPIEVEILLCGPEASGPHKRLERIAGIAPYNSKSKFQDVRFAQLQITSVAILG